MELAQRPSEAVTSPYPQEEVLLLDHLVLLLHGQVQTAAIIWIVQDQTRLNYYTILVFQNI